MSIDLERRPLAAALRRELRHELEALRGNWFWFVILGVALVVLGLVALGSVVITSLAAAVVIGVLLLLGGAAEVVGAFWCRGWSGFFLHLLAGVLSIVVGILFVLSPGAAAEALTLLSSPPVCAACSSSSAPVSRTSCVNLAAAPPSRAA